MNQQRHLAAWVIIDGQAFGPEHDLPADIAARITNPHAWPPDVPALADVPAGSAIDGSDADMPGLMASAKSSSIPRVTNDRAAPRDAAVPPPRSGKGSGADAWKAYAHAVNVDIEANADRGEIIAACERAGRIASP